MMSTMQNALMIAAGVAGTALAAWPLVIWYEVRRLEKPKYRVVKTLEATGRFVPPVEVREYAPYLVAEVTFDTSTPDMRKALSEGFRNIARYIFDSKGEGQQPDGPAKEKIAMTSPVTAEMTPGGGYKVAFVMPSKYTAESIPRPANSRVEIKEVGAHTLAALSFRGKSPREPQVEQRKQQLAAILKKHDISVSDDAAVRIYQFHPPFAPSPMRLNEVLLPVGSGGS